MEEEILTKLKNVSEKLENFLKSYDWYGIKTNERDVEKEISVWKDGNIILKGKTRNTTNDLAKDTEEEIFYFLTNELKEFIDAEKSSIDWNVRNYGLGNFIYTHFELKIKSEFLKFFRKLASRIVDNTKFYIVNGFLTFTVLTVRYEVYDYEEILTNLEKIKNWLNC